MHRPTRLPPLQASPAPAIPRPEKGISYVDPQYGACITRLTDHAHEPPVGFARNDYSRREPFNADGTKLLVYARDGSWHLYDPRDGSYIGRLPLRGNDTEPQWDPTDPDVLYALPNHGGLEIDRYDLRAGDTKVAADFRDLASIEGYPDAHSLLQVWPAAARVWTRTEGSPSRDMRFWAFQVETRDFRPLGLISYDLTENRILGVYDFQRDGGGIGRPDHISISPKGNFVVVSWNGQGLDCLAPAVLGTRDAPCGLMAFSRDFKQAVGLAVRGPHSDLALTRDGQEVAVIANYVSGNVEMIDLASGRVTPLWRIYLNGASTAMHISGKAYARPGWVLISTYGLQHSGGTIPWYTSKLMAVELTAQPRIFLLAAIHDRASQYFSEPQAAVNRDFTRAVFNANWGTGRDTDVDVYRLELAPDSLPTTP